MAKKLRRHVPMALFPDQGADDRAAVKPPIPPSAAKVTASSTLTVLP